MHTKSFAPLLLVLVSAVALSSSGDDIDRIIGAIGVDSIHSENEEVRTRQAVAMALAEVAKQRSAPTPPPEGPEFEALVKENIEANQRVRRDPRVWEAYRATLNRMLTPGEAAAAAAFYSTPAGRNAHIAVIEAEKAAGQVIEEIDTRK